MQTKIIDREKIKQYNMSVDFIVLLGEAYGTRKVKTNNWKNERK